jgi:hypothetical protein
MATSVHLPKQLLAALERELHGAGDWSPGFFDRLSQAEADTAEAVDDLLRAVHAARRSKAARTL